MVLKGIHHQLSTGGITKLVCFDVSGVLCILALIGFKSTYAIKASTALSSLLTVKAGL
jgi:hypothetical protein